MRLLSRMQITVISNLICSIAEMTQTTIFRQRLVFLHSILTLGECMSAMHLLPNVRLNLIGIEYWTVRSWYCKSGRILIKSHLFDLHTAGLHKTNRDNSASNAQPHDKAR